MKTLNVECTLIHLRVLDSKNPEVQALLSDAPKLQDHLDEASAAHFSQLCERLTQLGISYRVNPKLVRGLDYYNATVFEWVTDTLGAQGTICAGGRYDGLVEQLGGKAAPAVGFALGLERLVLMLTELGLTDDVPAAVDVYVTALGEDAVLYAQTTAEMLRDTTDLRVQMHCGGGNMKKQLKRADSAQARVALLIGGTEASDQQVTIKYLGGDADQTTVALAQLSSTLNAFFNP
jgi:histidyl-tRNA synthetase